MLAFERCVLRSFFIALLVLFILSACGGGGGGAGSGSPAAASGSGSSTSSSSSSSSASSSSSSASSASSSSSSASSSSTSGGPFVRRADLAACDPGELRDSERQVALNRVNEVRALHGLLPVSYDASHDAAAAEAALYMVANQTLTHSPSGGNCYTSGAYNLASTSNLYLLWYVGVVNLDGVSSASFINGFLIDYDVASLGHRRWILDPFLGSVTFGRVDGQPAGNSRYYSSAVLKVIGNGRSDVSAMSGDFVAYPQGNYPASYVRGDWFLSFSAIASKTNAWANGSGQVSYAGASITVSDGSQNLAVSEQSANYVGYGIANSLQWKVAGLQNNVDYTVTIANVSVNGVTRSYTYSFRLQ